MSSFTAFFDTNVLVPIAMRDLLMQLASTGAFRAKVSHTVIFEMRRVLVDDWGHPADKIDRCIEHMQSRALDSIVHGYESSIEGLKLPDPDDRHVLAAAIHGGAGVIVTCNLKHFPQNVVEHHGIHVQHPDEFVANLLDLHPQAVVGSVQVILDRLKNPPLTPSELFDVYTRNQLVKTAVELRGYFGGDGG